jgi:hypothetical protein
MAERPSPLVPLYVTFGALQALDIDSTLRALGNGGRESNPVIGGAVGSPGALIAIKAGATAGIVFASEKLWKRNRVAAVLMMIAMDSAYAAVVAHNYHLAQR